MVSVRSRHDRIATRLSNEIYRGDIVLELTVPEDPGRDRPDIVVRDGTRVTIIDIACLFENDENALQTAADRKVEKYQYLIPHFATQCLTAKVFPFIVGALGVWFHSNESVLNELRISHRYRTLFRKLCCADTIQGSRYLYINHLN